MLLIITDGEKEHYVYVKNLNFLLKTKGKCSERYCLNCFKRLRTKSRLEKHYCQEDKIVNHFHNQSLNQFHNHQ